MKELMTFLLPATVMDWVFAILMIAWASFALYAASQAKKSIDTRIKHSHFKNIKSSAHDLAIASRHPFWDHVVDDAPGFALILGLLGTFLGIGLAIQGAGHILADLNTNATNATDIRQTIGNLSPMMAEIGLKFKSSAWGIMTHIFLRFAIQAYGIEEKRLHEIFTELEQDYDDDKAERAERWAMLQNVETLLNDALFSKNAKDGSIASLMVRQNEHLFAIAEVQKDFGKYVRDLGSSVKEFEQTVGEFREGVKKSLTDMQNSVQKTSKGLKDAVDMMKDEVRMTFGEFKENVSTTLNKVGNDISTSSLAIKSSVDELSQTMATELQSVTRVTADLSTHSREMAVAITDQMQKLEEMGDKVQNIASQGAKYGFALEDVTANISKLAGADGVMVRTLDDLVNEAKASKDIAENVVTQLEKILVENRKVAHFTEKAADQKKGIGGAVSRALDRGSKQ